MKISQTTNNGEPCWRVFWKLDGKPKRNFFPTKAAAETFAAAKKAELSVSCSWRDLSPREQAEAAMCVGWGREKGYTLTQACQYFEGHDKTQEKVTVREMVDRFLLSKARKRAEYVRILKVTMDQFLEGRETIQVSNITTKDINAFMKEQGDERGWGNCSNRRVLIDLKNLFNWGMKQSPPLILRNPAEGVETPKMVLAEPEIFTPEQCWDLLDVCRREYPDVLPWLVFCLFAGLRPSEAKRLRWEDVSKGYINITGEKSKTGERRYVPVNKTLEAWLATISKTTGPILADTKDRDLRRAWVAVTGKWPSDVLRHSCISYDLAMSKDIKRVAADAGNSPSIIFKHYRRPMTPEDAKPFWAILPNSPRPGSVLPENVLPLTQAKA